jgi:hypothetical protein
MGEADDSKKSGEGELRPSDIFARLENEERFLSTQADPFTGVKGEEKLGPLRSK